MGSSDTDFNGIVGNPYHVGGSKSNFDSLPQVYSNSPFLNTFSRFGFYYPIDSVIIKNNETLNVNWTPILHSQGFSSKYNLYYVSYSDVVEYEYNKNHPNPWRTIVTDLDTSNYLWNTSLLNKTGYYKLRVNISCINGFTKSYDVCVNFGDSIDSRGIIYSELCFIINPLFILYYRKKIGYRKILSDFSQTL